MRVVQAQVVPAEQERALVKQFEDLDLSPSVGASETGTTDALWLRDRRCSPEREEKTTFCLGTVSRRRHVAVPSAADAVLHSRPRTGPQKRREKRSRHQLPLVIRVASNMQ